MCSENAFRQTNSANRGRAGLVPTPPTEAEPAARALSGYDAATIGRHNKGQISWGGYITKRWYIYLLCFATTAASRTRCPILAVKDAHGLELPGEAARLRQLRRLCKPAVAQPEEGGGVVIQVPGRTR